MQATRQYNTTKTAYRNNKSTQQAHLRVVGESSDFQELRRIRQEKMKRKKREKLRRKLTFIFIGAVTALLACAVAVGGYRLKQRNEVYEIRIAELEKEIAAEEQRALDLQEYSKYVQTSRYVEEVARDKLGMVMPGEVVFKPEN